MNTTLWKKLDDQQAEKLSGGETVNNVFSSLYNYQSGVTVTRSSYPNNYIPVGDPGWADSSGTYSYSGDYFSLESSYALGSPGSSPMFKSKQASSYTFYV